MRVPNLVVMACHYELGDAVGEQLAAVCDSESMDDQNSAALLMVLNWLLDLDTSDLNDDAQDEVDATTEELTEYLEGRRV
jgi:hypothetical protein